MINLLLIKRLIMEERRRLQRQCQHYRDRFPPGFNCNVSNDRLRSFLSEIATKKEEQQEQLNRWYDSSLFQFEVLPRLNIVLIRRLSLLRRTLMLITEKDHFWKQHVQRAIKLRYTDTVINRFPTTMKWRRYALMFSPRFGRSVYHTGIHPAVFYDHTTGIAGHRYDSTVPRRLPITGPIKQFYATHLRYTNPSEYVLHPSGELEITTYYNVSDERFHHDNIEKIVAGSDSCYSIVSGGVLSKGPTFPERIVDGYRGFHYKVIITESGTVYIASNSPTQLIPLKIEHEVPVVKAVLTQRDDRGKTVLRLLQCDGRVIDLLCVTDVLNDEIDRINGGRGRLNVKFTRVDPNISNAVYLQAHRDEVTTITADGTVYTISHSNQQHEYSIKYDHLVRFAQYTDDDHLVHRATLLDNGYVYAEGRNVDGQLGIAEGWFMEQGTEVRPTRVELIGVLEVICLPRSTYFLCE